MKAQDYQPDTEQLLWEWGRWARQDKGIGYATVAVFGLGSTVPSASMSDEDAEIISRAVAKLKLRDAARGAVIVWHYKDLWSDTRIQNRLNHNRRRSDRVSRQYVMNLRRAGVAWIDGVLSERE